MRKILLALIVTAAFSSQTVLADDAMMGEPSNKACTSIAKACMKAGYTEKMTSGKHIWFNCMKPAVMGKEVKGAKFDAADVKDCRTFKIDKMKTELKELESVN